MIVQALVEGVLYVLTALLEAIPDVTLPFGNYPDRFAQEIGGALGSLDAVVPVTEASVVVGWFLVSYVPIVVTFVVVRWVYEHLPVIGNGG